MSPPNNDSSSLTTHALQKEFRPKLKHHMEYCLDHFQKLQKLPSLREQVQEVKEGVLENINKGRCATTFALESILARICGGLLLLKLGL
ncbi:hypothetical protein GOP47_0030140 [Adiantum capillus-veneris]|nr:hypothetical protein GOP47_0030140 [Adiantum capillus-veneris]